MDIDVSGWIASSSASLRHYTHPISGKVAFLDKNPGLMYVE